MGWDLTKTLPLPPKTTDAEVRAELREMELLLLKIRGVGPFVDTTPQERDASKTRFWEIVAKYLEPARGPSRGMAVRVPPPTGCPPAVMVPGRDTGPRRRTTSTGPSAMSTCSLGKTRSMFGTTCSVYRKKEVTPSTPAPASAR